jgi:hypothetical protein
MGFAMVQVIELLWNLFDLAPDTGNQAAAASSSSAFSTQQQPEQQRQQGICQQDAYLEQQQQEPQVPLQGSPCEQPQQMQQQDHQQEPCYRDHQPPGNHHTSPVAEQLVTVLAVALQQQVATSNSVQVGGCVWWAPALTGCLCLIQPNTHTALCTCLAK